MGLYTFHQHGGRKPPVLEAVNVRRVIDDHFNQIALIFGLAAERAIAHLIDYMLRRGLRQVVERVFEIINLSYLMFVLCSF